MLKSAGANQAAVLILIAVAWSFIGEIDQVVTAPGKVIPHDKVKWKSSRARSR